MLELMQLLVKTMAAVGQHNMAKMEHRQTNHGAFMQMEAAVTMS